MIDKAAHFAELVALLERDLAQAERSQAATREAATHEEAKPENDKDTRALEQSYLARGQSLRLEQQRAELAAVIALAARLPHAPDRAALGTLVRYVGDDGAARRVLLAPGGAGIELREGVRVVSPRSPLGRALIGGAVGDVVELERAGGADEIELLALE